MFWVSMMSKQNKAKCEKELAVIERKVAALMKTAKWRKSFEKSNKQVEETIEKLEQASKVDPRLLDEPATI